MMMMFLKLLICKVLGKEISELCARHPWTPENTALSLLMQGGERRADS